LKFFAKFEEMNLSFFVLLTTLQLAVSFSLTGKNWLISKGSAVSTLRLNGVSDVVNVDLGDRSYPIYIGRDLLNIGDELRKHVTCKKALIVTNTKVGPLYTAQVRKNLEQGGVEVFEIVLPDGEEFKTMEVMMMIIDKAMEIKLDRKSAMIALGGGVIGDTTGFAAAIYQRGIKFVQVPTSLMAMVDSAVGGKTAVNHPSGKNMIGAFYQPDAVIIDTDTLSTLPDRELRSGISEVYKYGLIRDVAFFEWLEANVQGIMSRDPVILAETIRRSCQNKAEVVALDEKEGGVRATLNLGHTFGHAIETGMGYGAWLHGEAVAAGTVMAAEMSFELGWIDAKLCERIKDLTLRAGLPVSIENPYTKDELGTEEYNKRMAALTPAYFLDLMSMDKKVADGQLSLVLLEGSLGTSLVTKNYSREKLEGIVKAYCKK
jgi:3-dehydroquinate synthase